MNSGHQAKRLRVTWLGSPWRFGPWRPHTAVWAWIFDLGPVRLAKEARRV